MRAGQRLRQRLGQGAAGGWVRCVREPGYGGDAGPAFAGRGKGGFGRGARREWAQEEGGRWGR